jgi:dynein heavy chain
MLLLLLLLLLLNSQVPWDDLRYIFGEIMYGGHIVEDWDRRLAGAYLLKYINEGLLEGLEMFPGFMTPGNSLSHKQVSWLACTAVT